MSRAISLALNQFEVRGFEFPSLQSFHAVYSRLTRVNTDAAAVFVANENLRSSARGWLL